MSLGTQRQSDTARAHTRTHAQTTKKRVNLIIKFFHFSNCKYLQFIKWQETRAAHKREKEGERGAYQSVFPITIITSQPYVCGRCVWLALANICTDEILLFQVTQYGRRWTGKWSQLSTPDQRETFAYRWPDRIVHTMHIRMRPAAVASKSTAARRFVYFVFNFSSVVSSLLFVVRLNLFPEITGWDEKRESWSDDVIRRKDKLSSTKRRRLLLM